MACHGLPSMGVGAVRGRASHRRDLSSIFFSPSIPYHYNSTHIHYSFNLMQLRDGSVTKSSDAGHAYSYKEEKTIALVELDPFAFLSISRDQDDARPSSRPAV